MLFFLRVFLVLACAGSDWHPPAWDCLQLTLLHPLDFSVPHTWSFWGLDQRVDELGLPMYFHWHQKPPRTSVDQLLTHHPRVWAQSWEEKLIYWHCTIKGNSKNLFTNLRQLSTSGDIESTFSGKTLVHRWKQRLCHNTDGIITGVREQISQIFLKFFFSQLADNCFATSIFLNCVLLCFADNSSDFLHFFQQQKTNNIGTCFLATLKPRQSVSEWVIVSDCNLLA